MASENDDTEINAVEVEGGRIELRTPPPGRKSKGKARRPAHAREVFVPGPPAEVGNEPVMPPAATIPAPPPVHVSPVPEAPRRSHHAAPASPTPSHPKNEPTNDALARWPLVLDHARGVMEARGYGFDPGTLTIRCWRTQLGSYTVGAPSKVQMPGAIDGATVAGDDVTSAADQLLEAVLQMWHMVGHRHGPATYTLDFNWKRAPDGHGGSRICTGDLTLDSPDAIAEQRRGTEQFRRGREQAGFGVGAPPAPSRWGTPAPQPISNWGSPPTPWPAASPAIPQLEEIRRELHAALGSRETSDEVRQLLNQHLAAVQQMMASAPAASIMPVAPVAPQISAEDQSYIEEGRFRALAGRLGWVPPDVARQQAAAAVQAAQPPAVTPGAASTGVGESVGGLEGMLKSFERFDALKPRFARLAGLELPEPGTQDPPETPEKPEDKNPLGLTEVPGTRFMGHAVIMPTKTEGLVETGQAFLMANPVVAIDLAQKLGAILTSKPIMGLIERVTGGAPPAPPQMPAAPQMRPLPAPLPPPPIPTPPTTAAAPSLYVAPPGPAPVGGAPAANGIAHGAGVSMTPSPARPVFRGHTA